jgi:hypothetical protein
MAVQTLTSTIFDRQAIAVHTGNITVGGSIAVPGTTNTLSDVIFLAKIPHGAMIVDVLCDHTTAQTALGIKYGLATGTAAGGGASASCFTAATAKATVTRKTSLGNNTAGVPVRISVSDNDPNRYGIFAATLSTGTTTDSYAINFSITYRVDSFV